MIEITRKLKLADPQVGSLYSFIGDASVILTEADFKMLGRPEEIVVEVSVPNSESP